MRDAPFNDEQAGIRVTVQETPVSCTKDWRTVDDDAVEIIPMLRQEVFELNVDEHICLVAPRAD